MTAVARLTEALAGRYRVDRELGAGGMATVYLAQDLRHHRRVALKVVREELSAGLGSERFLREIRLAAGLHHPNILPLYDSGDAGGNLYYVMPVAEGESLRDRLQRDGTLSVGDAVRLAREVAGALDYAHRHEVVHRDIKPENILLHDGHALITDFGIGKAFSSADAGATLTQIGLAVGTPAYMSPEQAGGETSLDGRSDLYSLGCVLYEMLTGMPPFSGPSVQSVIAKRFTEPPPDATATRSSVPRALADVVRKLMATERAGRYATGAEAAEALARCVTPSNTLVVERDSGAERARIEGLRAPQPAATVKSIAVLPFANMSAAAEDEYFADGMTEEIINALVQVRGLKVAARTSCFAFKGRNEDLRVVAEKLGVQTLLEGSVRKSGSRVRITAQLINASDGYHLWSERYDRELTDVFALQDELAGAIAGKLHLSLLNAELRRVGPRNVEAYEQLLKGRVLLGRRGRAILDAIPCFEQAVHLDPELAEAHALAGDACRLLAMYGMAPSTEMMPRAKAAAERALALDPTQVEAIATLAGVTATYEGDIARSISLTDRALAIDPFHVRALCERAAVLSMRELGPPEIERVLADVRTARQADPLNSWAAAIEALALTGFGRFDDALSAAHAAVELDPSAFTGHWVTVWILAATGRDADALAAAEPALRMSGRSPLILAEVAAIHARGGALASAEAIHQELRGRSRAGYVSGSVQGAVAASAGHLDEARTMVARGIEARDTYLLFWKSPAWAPFRADPEGLAMLRRSRSRSPGFG